MFSSKLSSCQEMPALRSASGDLSEFTKHGGRPLISFHLLRNSVVSHLNTAKPTRNRKWKKHFYLMEMTFCSPAFLHSIIQINVDVYLLGTIPDGMYPRGKGFAAKSGVRRACLSVIITKISHSLLHSSEKKQLVHCQEEVSSEPRQSFILFYLILFYFVLFYFETVSL